MLMPPRADGPARLVPRRPAQGPGLLQALLVVVVTPPPPAPMPGSRRPAEGFRLLQALLVVVAPPRACACFAQPPAPGRCAPARVAARPSAQVPGSHAGRPRAWRRRSRAPTLWTAQAAAPQCVLGCAPDLWAQDKVWALPYAPDLCGCYSARVGTCLQVMGLPVHRRGAQPDACTYRCWPKISPLACRLSACLYSAAASAGADFGDAASAMR